MVSVLMCKLFQLSFWEHNKWGLTQRRICILNIVKYSTAAIYF